MKNYYKILGIELDADLIAIKKAYRRLALNYHPDKNKEPNAADKFIEITEAYEVLRNPIKRKEYDKVFSMDLGSNSDQSEFEKNHDRSYYEKQQEWSDLGRKKAREYASIPFEEFARYLLKEISIGVNYIPNLIAIVIVVALAIYFFSSIPIILKDSPSSVLLSIALPLGLCYLAYRLFLVAKADYLEDRNRKI